MGFPPKFAEGLVSQLKFNQLRYINFSKSTKKNMRKSFHPRVKHWLNDGISIKKMQRRQKLRLLQQKLNKRKLKMYRLKKQKTNKNLMIKNLYQLKCNNRIKLNKHLRLRKMTFLSLHNQQK